MPTRIQYEIDKLKKSILSLGAVAEERVAMAVKAVSERDEALAREVIEGDAELDQMEVDLEEECLKVLALHQPVAVDLRFIIAVLKINNDLERIGDLAVNIGERAVFLASRPHMTYPLDFSEMAQAVKKILKHSLDALVNLDVTLAYEVCKLDDQVDAINRQMYIQVQKTIRKDPDRVESLIHLLNVSRHLERIADQATNIAEDVIYMIEGRIIRHKIEEDKPLHSPE